MTRPVPMIETEGRSVPEWISDHPDQAIPDRVKVRIWARCKGRCGLTGKKLRAGDGVDYDHITALADGGEHRESNLHVVWRKAHRRKTAAEATERAEIRSLTKNHFGLGNRKAKGRSLTHPKLKRTFSGEVVPR